jgi:hypothetical protein
MTWTTRQNPYVMVAATYQIFALVRCAMGIVNQNDDDIWLFGCMAAVLVPILAIPLGRRAVARGYSWAWGGLAIVGIAGLLVVSMLPKRSLQRARGFPIEPIREQP